MSASYDFDPVPADAQFQGDSLLERISRAYEEAIDAYGDACDREADDENTYLREFATAWAYAVEDGVAATVRSKHCDTVDSVCRAKQDWNRAAAAVKRTKAKADVLQHRQMACMSHQRFVREAT